MACTAKTDCAAYLGRSYPSRLPPLFGKSPIEPRQFVFSHVLQANNITKQRALGADLGTRPAAHPPGPALPPPRCTDLGRSCPRRAAPAVLPAIGPAAVCEALRNTHHRLKMCNFAPCRYRRGTDPWPARHRQPQNWSECSAVADIWSDTPSVMISEDFTGAARFGRM